MSVDTRLLDILVCPATKVPVRRLPKDKLAILNRAIEDGGIRSRDGSAVASPLTEALVTTDGKTVYPVEDGLPIMLEDCGIEAAQVPGW